MSRNNPYIYIGLLIGLLLPSFLPAGPIGHVLVKGYEKTYRINRAPGVTEIVWQVFTDPLCTVPANPDAVELIYGTGENNQEVTVRWITEGTFYLMVSMMGESSCLNRKAWPFTIESPVQLQASAFCSDGLPWIRWDATIHGFSVDTISIDLFDVQGNRVLTIADAPLSGTMPWPGVTDKSNLVVPEALAILDLNARFDRIPGADPITIRLDAPDCSQPSVIAINDTVVAWHGIVNIFDILFNDFDSEGMLDSSSVIIVSSTGNGSFTLDPVSGRVEYTPDDCYFGLDSLVYVVSNTSGITSNEAIVLIRVEINPDIDSDGDGILDIDELLVDTGNLCDTDTDMDGIPNYLDPDDDGDDIPTADEPGDLDGNGIPDYLEDWNSRAVDDLAATAVDIPVWISVHQNDSTTLIPATIQILAAPVQGYVSVDPGTYDVNYFPDYDFMGQDSFLYVVCDHYNVCDTALVVINIEDVIIPPQVFTPNDDGYNDRYMIRNLERYPDNHFVVFNRWGNVVYEQSNYANDWDGQSNAKYKVGGEPLPVGVYYYILKYAHNQIKQGGLFLQR